MYTRDLDSGIALQKNSTDCGFLTAGNGSREFHGFRGFAPNTFIFGGFRGKNDPGDRLQGFWITPKTKKVTAILKIRIFTTIPASGDTMFGKVFSKPCCKLSPNVVS